MRLSQQSENRISGGVLLLAIAASAAGIFNAISLWWGVGLLLWAVYIRWGIRGFASELPPAERSQYRFGFVGAEVLTVLAAVRYGGA
jgi:hypothetical protein